MNIFISNLGYNVKDQDLIELFQSFGTVVSAKIITDRDTGRSRGFAFVGMENKADGQKAIEELNNSTYQNRVLVVNEARPQEDRSNGNSSFSGRNRW